MPLSASIINTVTVIRATGAGDLGENGLGWDGFFDGAGAGASGALCSGSGSAAGVSGKAAGVLGADSADWSAGATATSMRGGSDGADTGAETGAGVGAAGTAGAAAAGAGAGGLGGAEISITGLEGVVCGCISLYSSVVYYITRLQLEHVLVGLLYY